MVSTTQERASNLAIISIKEELEQQLNYDDTTDEFMNAMARKVQFGLSITKHRSMCLLFNLYCPSIEAYARYSWPSISVAYYYYSANPGIKVLLAQPCSMAV
jgi:hypothetical protein